MSDLSPSDAVVALRSFPRRFREALAVEGGDDAGLDDALREVDAAGRDLAVLADAVRRALTEDRPTVHPAVLDESSRVFPDGIDVSVEAALDLVSLESDGLADRIEHVPADEWTREAVVPGSGDATALDLLREAVRTTAAHLRAAERARGRS